MKAIKIDVVNETVTDVDIKSSDTLNEMYRQIGCDMVEVACYPEFGDHGECVMVDENGMACLTPQSKFFTITGGHQPFAGNGLIVGTNFSNGATVGVGITAEEAKKHIKFLTLHQVKGSIA